MCTKHQVVLIVENMDRNEMVTILVTIGTNASKRKCECQGVYAVLSFQCKYRTFAMDALLYVYLGKHLYSKQCTDYEHASEERAR